MKRAAASAWLALVVSLTACASSTENATGTPSAKTSEQATSAPEGSTMQRPDKPCLEKLVATHATSLDTVPLPDGDMLDFPKTVYAKKIDLRHTPEPRLTPLRLVDRPVFFAPEGKDAKGRPAPTVVDEGLFSDLACVDATRVRAGQIYPVGKATRDAMGAGPQRIASTLIQSGVVRPFVHMEATLCLVQQETDATSRDWTGRYEGTHTYFTNEKNVDPIAFLVRITAEGAISVEGR